MLASELIAELKAAIEAYGDLEVTCDNYGGSYANLVGGVNTGEWKNVYDQDIGEFVKADTPVQVIMICAEEGATYSEFEG